MLASVPNKSAAQRARLRSRLMRRQRVRRHGDHTSKCVVWRKKESGVVELSRFRAPSKFQRCGLRARAEAELLVPPASNAGVYSSPEVVEGDGYTVIFA